MLPKTPASAKTAVPGSLTPSTGSTRSRPDKKIDRSFAVGSPLLDGSAEEGLYVWLEDGWFQLAAVGPTALKTEGVIAEPRTFKVTVDSTSLVKADELGDFLRERKEPRSFVARVTTGGVPAAGRFRTDGDLVRIAVTESGRRSGTVGLFVGPLAERVVDEVEIGRY